MLNKNGVSGRVVFACAELVVLGILGVGAVNAAEPQCYSLVSLQGNYAVITEYGDNVAKAFGIRYYDGNGHFTGSFIINEPKPGSTAGERMLVSGTQGGTYTVNCDGTGVINRVVTLPDGTTVTQMDDFVITSATAIAIPPGKFFAGQLIATALADAGRDPSPIVAGALFVTHTYSRLPDRQSPRQ
jgi:hypothetical protein